MTNKKWYQSIKDRDKASINNLQIRYKPGVYAVRKYRLAHYFFTHHMKLLGLYISYRARKKTGVEIHPGATIGKNLFIDHGMGVVIGETAIIGDNCMLFHGVTLGSKSSVAEGRRHPKLGDNVIVGCGATILGGVTIGDNSKIAPNTLILSDVPANVLIKPTNINQIIPLDSK